MQFLVHARVFKRTPARVEIRDIWDIADSELSPNGKSTIALIADDSFPTPRLRHDTVWGGQALVEFQDLQAIPIPTEGRFFNVNFLFCEGLSVLREAVVCGLNGQTHSSLAALRSALELLSFHYWWKKRLLGTRTYEQFYHWLLQGKGGRSFSDVIRELYAAVILPPDSVGESQFRELYAKLCSYAHKPLLEEAINTIRKGNQTVPDQAVVLFWLHLLNGVQRAVLEIAISQTPHALFPLELHKKFGFNPPLGIFFDHANFLPLREALSSDTTTRYQAHYRDQDPPKSQIQWFEAMPDLTCAQILASWTDEVDIENEGELFDERVFRRYCLMKAKTRSLTWAFAYGRDVPDVAELARRTRTAN
jgi:hypothetical protein